MTSKSSPFFRSLLDSVGQLNNTYIVFTSDNGFHLGQHRLFFGKETGFEEDIHTPLLIRGPGLPAGRVVDSLTVNIDFAPTFAELAGATTPGFVDGRSLVPLLDGTLPTTWRNSFLLGHSRIHATATFGNYVRQEQPSFNGVRTERWVYMRMPGGEVALYDLVNNPDEHVNAAASNPDIVMQLDQLTNPW
jgi:arylsulfatase A-like enzyme